MREKRIQILLKVSELSSAHQRNAIQMAFRWWAYNGPTWNAGLLAFFYFQGIWTSITKKPYRFVIFQVGSIPPVSPLWIRACLSKHTVPALIKCHIMWHFNQVSIVCKFTHLEVSSLQKIKHMSRDMRFPTMRYVQPTKPQISLRINFHVGI